MINSNKICYYASAVLIDITVSLFLCCGPSSPYPHGSIRVFASLHFTRSLMLPDGCPSGEYLLPARTATLGAGWKSCRRSERLVCAGGTEVGVFRTRLANRGTRLDIRIVRRRCGKFQPKGVPACPDGQIELASQEKRSRPVRSRRTPEGLMRTSHTLPWVHCSR